MIEGKIEKIRLFQSSPKIFDKNGKELSVHFRVNKIENQLEIVINRSCNKCLNFKKINGDIEICTKCKYIKGWMDKGKR